MSKSYDMYGLSVNEHGNCKTTPAHALSFDDTTRIKKFIEEYANKNALPLPGRLPNCPKQTVLLLPCEKNVTDIYDLYMKSAKEANYRVVSLKTFRNKWNSLCPHIAVATPATDLCVKCQKFMGKLKTNAHLSDEERHNVLSDYTCHVQKANRQRQLFKNQVLCSKAVCSTTDVTEGAEPCSLDATLHYSWDFAQCVHYPHHAMQVGPIYFATPRKCHVFGMCAEGTGIQRFYMIDESEMPGKGGDCVTSLVHHYFSHFGAGEKHAEIHFDNAVGQNKNNTILGYCMWRVLTGLHESVSLSMMLPGHTNLSKYYHFRCTADEPGVLICREFCDSEEVRFNLLKARPEAGCLPTVKVIPPLDHLRQWYLYEKIAPFFINEVARDIVCPKPSIPK
ncbi:uncharacterized protein LOC127868504 isoform X1 [Dreissena polymorpha]|nr:uncharacterized protein LOC127868504 isoform X1 [Dreissena polymorpha]